MQKRGSALYMAKYGYHNMNIIHEIFPIDFWFCLFGFFFFSFLNLPNLMCTLHSQHISVWMSLSSRAHSPTWPVAILLDSAGPDG